MSTFFLQTHALNINRSGRVCVYTTYINQTADRKTISAYYNLYFGEFEVC